MTRRGRSLALAAAVLVALLFAGRWTASILAEQWWGSQFSAGAGVFLGQWHLLSLTLEVGAVILATGWFVGHLLTVYRAIGSVQIPRHVGNVEILEALSPQVLLTGVLALGALLGILVGTGAPVSAGVLALAWHGVSYGSPDPLLGHDLGLYVAQLPLWRASHAFALLLSLLGFGGALTLYLIVGAVRWIDGRPAINGHARRHLGWLLVTVALVLAWGYLLEPYEYVAGLHGAVDPSAFRAVALVAPALAGTGLMVAVLSGLWAVKARHSLVIAAWLVLVLASAVGHYLVPVLLREPGTPPAPPEMLRHLDGLAFDLSDLATPSAPLRPGSDPPPAPLSLWDDDMLARLTPDSSDLLALAPAMLALPGGARPVWLDVTTDRDGGTAVTAVADDRASGNGAPLFYRPGDSLAYPTAYAFALLPAHALRPLAPGYDIGPAAPGPAAGGWLQRIVLAWALQAPGLLADANSTDRVGWRLEPTERLAHLAPFAEWAPASPRQVGGRLVWLCDGYVDSRTFPIVSRVAWQGRSVGSLSAGFVGVVDAVTGETHVYLRPGAGPLARAWAALAPDVVEDLRGAAPNLIQALDYPPDLLSVQATVLAGDEWQFGQPVTKSTEGGSPEPELTIGWPADRSGLLRIVPFQSAEERRLRALLVGRTTAEGQSELTLVAVDSTAALPSPAALEATWTRFPLYEEVRDSVRATGAALESGPIRYWLGGGALTAYQVYYGTRRSGRPAMVWLSAATGQRVGAGRNLAEAWGNLRGTSVPIPPGSAVGALGEATRWMRLADSALRVGDWATFGRAFAALRSVLEPPMDTATKHAK